MSPAINVDNITLTWILLVAAALSLAISVTTFILQLRQSHQRGQTPIAMAKANRQKKRRDRPPSVTGTNSPYQTMYTQPSHMNPGYPPYASEPWRSPAPPFQNDTSGQTEPLFSSVPQPAVIIGDKTEQIRNDVYRVLIRESSPEGTKESEIMVCGKFAIGRSVTSGLVINNTTVSGVQCVLIAGPDCIFAINRSSSNVTRLNGIKLEGTRPVKVGDTLNLGSVQLLLLDIQKYATN